MLNYTKIIELNQREKIKLATKNNQLQQGISSKRDLLIQWLISSTFQNKISLKTIELAVLYIDNYLQSQTISDSNLQLLAISAFNLAAKFNQKGMLQQTKIISPNGVNMYQDIDYDNMEVELLQKMQYQLNFITSSDYAELLGLNLQDERIKSYFLFILLDQNIYQFKHLELALAISLLSDNQNLQFQPKIHKISEIIQMSVEQQESIFDDEEAKIKKITKIKSNKKIFVKKIMYQEMKTVDKLQKIQLIYVIWKLILVNSHKHKRIIQKRNFKFFQLNKFSNLPQMSQEQILNNDEIDFEDDIDLESLEMPQLVRRNGIIHEDGEVSGYFILDKPIDKIYHSEICPICLEEDEQLIPLKCGHTFCQNDIQKLAENSKQNQSLIKCPICRSYQILDNNNVVPDQNDFLELLIQSLC